MFKYLIPLLLFGCGFQEGDPLDDFLPTHEVSTAFMVPCMGPIVSEAPLDVDTFVSNVRLLRDVLSPIVPREDFCHVFLNVPIKVRNVEYLDVALQQTGTYNFFYGITLERSTRGLCHELLHAWDTGHLAFGTINHVNWDTNGYDTAIRKYIAAYRKP